MIDKLANLFPHRTVRAIHLYSSMLMLLIMLFFTITGITLNHQDWFSDTPPSQMTEAELPEDLLKTLIPVQDTTPDSLNANSASSDEIDAITLAAPLIRWLRDEYSVRGQEIRLDWDEEERFLVIDIQQPGGYSIAEFDLNSGEVVLEQKNAGVIHILNDLHKGRHSGPVWQLFIDLSALIMLLFTLSGFWLLLPQKKRRARLLGISGVGTGILLLMYWSTL